ncbi:aldehyde dehydrogenase family 2 member C4-like protein [Tanacetum coccineum]
MKVALALEAGCTVVIKPAENTPLVGLFMAYLSKLAGVPDGVIIVVNGFGSTAGAAVSSHMDIDTVTFYFLLVNITLICFAIQLMRYQSRLLLRVPPKVGRTVMLAAAESNLKPVSLELGGKSPFIVFDDADIEKAAEIAVLGNLSNKGEMCVAGSRVFVHEGIYDAFVKKLEATNNKQLYKKVLSHIELGKKEGATLVTGGKPFGNKGYYIEPTLFTNVMDEMTIAKEEIFCPVMKGISECKASEGNVRRIQVKGIVKEVKDYLKTYSSAEMDISWHLLLCRTYTIDL